MYFEAFDRAIEPPDIPKEVIFTAEYLVSQILTTASADFLKKALKEKNLADALYTELEFFGQVPKKYLSEIRLYLKNQENALREIAKKIITNGDEKLRKQLLRSPSHSRTKHLNFRRAGSSH